MSRPQLARRLGLSRQAIQDLEERESSGAVTLAALSRAAKAMDVALVYALVPRKSLPATVRAQARAVALVELKPIAHSMRLEEQGVSPAEFETQVADREEELVRTLPRQLWDEVHHHPE